MKSIACFICGLVFTSSIVEASSLRVVLFLGQSNIVGRPDNQPTQTYLQGQQQTIPYYYWVDVPETITSSWGTLAPVASTSWGPELSCLYALRQQGPVAGIKVAKGGSTIAVDWKTRDSVYYTLTTQTVSDALGDLSAGGTNAYISDIVWALGPTDSKTLAYANAYETNMVQFVNALREDLSCPGARFIVCKSWEGLHDYPGNIYVYLDTVQAAQASMLPIVGNARIVNTDDLTVQDDNAHYDEASYVELGWRIANAAWKPRRGTVMVIE